MNWVDAVCSGAETNGKIDFNHVFWMRNITQKHKSSLAYHHLLRYVNELAQALQIKLSVSRCVASVYAPYLHQTTAASYC